MITKDLDVPFFPFMNGLLINFPDMLYRYLQEDSNKLYLIAKHGKDIDFDEFEVNDKVYDDFAYHFIDALKWNGIPSWLENIEFQSLMFDSYNTVLKGNFKFTDDYENKLLVFKKENKEYIQERINSDWQTIYHGTFSDNFHNVDLWLDKNDEYYWTMIQLLNQYWFEVTIGYKENPKGNYEYLQGKFSTMTMEDFYLDNYIDYKRSKYISDEEREDLIKQNQKLIDDNYSEYKLLINKQC